jgi:hypothetical protein
MHLAYWLLKPLKLSCFSPHILCHPTPETLPEREYEARFSDGGFKKWGNLFKSGKCHHYMDADVALIGTGVIECLKDGYDKRADLTIVSMLRTAKWCNYKAIFADPRTACGGNVWQHMQKTGLS